MPETFLNFLATLGFSMGEDRERFSLEEMVDSFDWSRVSAGGPVFDPRKLEAFNGDDIRAMPAEELLERLQETALDDERLLALVRMSQPRLARLDDFVPYVSFFFGGSLDYAAVKEKLRIKRRSRKEVIEILRAFDEEVERDPSARSFTAEALEPFCRSFCERHEWKTKEVFTLLRLAVTGRTAAPSLFDTLAVCGKDRCRLRIRDTIALLKSEPDW
jgi:glutamyl-tRNA synthetase